MTPLIYAMHLEYLFILADSNYLQRFTQQHEVWSLQKDICLHRTAGTGLTNVRIHSARPFLSPRYF